MDTEELGRSAPRRWLWRWGHAVERVWIGPRYEVEVPADRSRNAGLISVGDIIECVDKHRRVLEAIFEKRANIAWLDIEAMLLHHGAELSEGRGSRLRIALNGIRAVFHRPHPQKETGRGAVASMRRFLIDAGVSVKRKL